MRAGALGDGRGLRRGGSGRLVPGRLGDRRRGGLRRAGLGRHLGGQAGEGRRRVGIVRVPRGAEARAGTSPPARASSSDSRAAAGTMGAAVLVVDERLLRRRERGLDGGRGLGLPLVHARREVEEEVLGVDAPAHRLAGDVPRAEGGRHLLGQLEGEGPLAEAGQLLEGEADARADELLALVAGQLAHAAIDGRRAGGDGGHDQAVPEDDAARAPVHLDGQVARLPAEGDDLDDVEEGQVLEVAGQAQAVSPRMVRTAGATAANAARRDSTPWPRSPRPGGRWAGTSRRPRRPPRPWASHRSRRSPPPRPGCAPRRPGWPAGPRCRRRPSR